MTKQIFRAAVGAMTLLCMASPVLADTSNASNAAGRPNEGKKAVDPRMDGQTIVCKREDSTGTRLGATKICHTRSEWTAMSADAREQSDKIINTPQTH